MSPHLFKILVVSSSWVGDRVMAQRLFIRLQQLKPRFTPPLHPKATLLNLHLDCAPCFKRICPLPHNNWLTHLMPEMGIAALP
ncbi:MAG: hypothetical protein QX197_09125 [Methylococcaceae bacterium]